MFDEVKERSLQDLGMVLKIRVGFSTGQTVRGGLWIYLDLGRGVPLTCTSNNSPHTVHDKILHVDYRTKGSSNHDLALLQFVSAQVSI